MGQLLGLGQLTHAVGTARELSARDRCVEHAARVARHLAHHTEELSQAAQPIAQAFLEPRDGDLVLAKLGLELLTALLLAVSCSYGLVEEALLL